MTRKVEVWSVGMNAELGTAYNASYWYRSNNGINTKAQAAQIRDQYLREHLPLYEDQAIDPSTKADRRLQSRKGNRQSAETSSNEEDVVPAKIKTKPRRRYDLRQTSIISTDICPDEMTRRLTMIHREIHSAHSPRLGI
jgi:hypothetical protein